MFKSKSTSLILLGILAVVVGILAIAWPGVTILALVILFAGYAFMGAAVQGARAFSSRAAGPVFGHLLLGLIDLAARVVALVWPAPTAFVLVIVVAAWALVGGVVEFFAGFQSGVGAVTLALLFGLYSLIYGLSQITAGIRVPDRLQVRFLPLFQAVKNASSSGTSAVGDTLCVWPSRTR